MINKIENVSQLHLEILRLRIQKNQQEQAIRQDIKDIHMSLKPLNTVIQGMASLFSPETGKTTIVKQILDFGINYFTNLYFKNSPGITKRLISFFAGNLTSKFIVGKSGWIIDRIKRIFTHKKSPTQTEENNSSEKQNC